MKIKPCPFCGRQVFEVEKDCLWETTHSADCFLYFWVKEKRTYLRKKDVEKWNRRPKGEKFSKKEITDCVFDVLKEYKGCDESTICGFVIGRLNAMIEERTKKNQYIPAPSEPEQGQGKKLTSSSCWNCGIKEANVRGTECRHYKYVNYCANWQPKPD